MKKSAEELATDVLGQEAKDRKRKERWIATLLASGIGTAASLATKNTSLKHIPVDALSAGISGLTFAELPRVLYKNPVEDANDPRWWRKDYSPMEHGLALGTGAGVGALGGQLLLKGLQSKGWLVPNSIKPFKGLAGTVATLAIPSIAGYMGARQLMRARDARRDAAAQPDLDAQIPDSPATV
jgi:hypothetical protein